MFEKNEKNQTMNFTSENVNVANVCRQFEVRKIIASIDQNLRKRFAFG